MSAERRDRAAPESATDFDAPVERRGSASFKWDLYGPDVLPLWVADMDFASPPAVVAALEARARHGVFGYALVTDAVVTAIARHLEVRLGWRVEADWLIWLPGVVPALNLVCRAFVGEGEAVMAVTPVYPPFLQAPPAQGRRLLAVPAELEGAPDAVVRSHGAMASGDDATAAARREDATDVTAQRERAAAAVIEATRWRLPLDGMEAALTPDTRVLLLCHPHNPLGRVWRRDEVEAVVGFCHRHDLVLCSDEIHCDLVLDGLGHVPAASLSDDAAARTVTLMSPSKTFNLPGLNFAFAIIPDEGLRRRFRTAAEGLLPFPGCFALAAAEAAYREGIPWLEGLLHYLRGNRDLVERFVAAELPVLTLTHVEATYLAWLDARGLGFADPARAFRRAGVALSDGADFGAPGYLRLNFACPRATLQEALTRMRRALPHGAG